MNEEYNYITVVSYETDSDGNSAVVCMRNRRDGKMVMVVGGFDEEADTIHSIVTKQGYLREHDIEIKVRLIEDLIGEAEAYSNSGHDFDIVKWLNNYRETL